jgi:hypothetical protein
MKRSYWILANATSLLHIPHSAGDPTSELTGRVNTFTYTYFYPLKFSVLKLTWEQKPALNPQASPQRHRFCDPVSMQADRVEVSWDPGKHDWLVRIEIGAQVIRRHCNHSREADEQALRKAAAQTVVDEGYQIDESRIAVVR